MGGLDLRTHASAIQIFVVRNRRWPSELVADPDEVALAQWLNGRRQDFAAGRLSSRVSAVLSSQIPGWRISGESRWLRYARALSDQLILHGRLDTHTPLQLVLWLQGQQEARSLGILEGPRKNWLDQHAPGWSEVPVAETIAVNPTGLGAHTDMSP